MTIEELKKFCWPDEIRPHLQEPFSQGKWTYATDGRVCVRVARMANVGERRNVPRGVNMKLFKTLKVVEKACPLPELPPLRGETQCEECSGRVQCDKCNGGWVPETAVRVKVGRHWVSHLYLHRIKDLPGLQVFESGVGDLEALGFTFEGGDGRLAPMEV